jgi:hypothetical protein
MATIAIPVSRCYGGHHQDECRSSRGTTQTPRPD